MAYGTKYTLQFSDLQGTVWDLKILKKDYVGASSAVKGTGDPCFLKYDGTDIYDPIHSSEAVVNLYSETDFAFSEFFNAAELDYLLQIEKGGVLFWEGIQVTEIYTEPYTGPPYNIRLRFTDGLGSLKYIDYPNALIDGMTSRRLLTIINDCLGALPYTPKKDIIEIVNVLENRTTENSSNWFLNTIFVNAGNGFRNWNEKTKAEEAWSCYDVIKEIMLSIGATIFQANNTWYVIRIEELENANPEFKTWLNGAGSGASGTIAIRKNITNTEVGLTFLEQAQTMSISEVFSDIEYKYQFFEIFGEVGERNAMNFIKDWEMNLSGWNPLAYRAAHVQTYLPFWKASAGILGEKGLMAAPELTPFLYSDTHWRLDIEEDPNTPRNFILNKANTFNSNLFIQPVWTSGGSITKEQIYSTVVDSAELIIELALILEWSSNNAGLLNATYLLELPFKIQLGTYYLKEDANGNLSWAQDSTQVIKIKKLLKYSDFNTISLPGTPIRKWFNFTAANQIKLELPLLPELGTIDFNLFMYIPVNPIIDMGASGNIRCTQFNIYELQFNLLPAESKMYNFLESVNIIAGIRQRKKEINIKFGDEPNVTVPRCFKIFTNPNYEKGEDWKLRGIAGLFDAQEIFILRPYSKIFGKYRKEIKGTLYGETNIDFFNAAVPKEGTSPYMQINSEHNLKTGEKNVELHELLFLTYVADITTVDFSDRALFPAGTMLSIDDEELIAAELGLQEVKSQDDTNTTNINLIERGGRIKKINDERGTGTNYDNYPV